MQYSPILKCKNSILSRSKSVEKQPVSSKEIARGEIYDIAVIISGSRLGYFHTNNVIKAVTCCGCVTPFFFF